MSGLSPHQLDQLRELIQRYELEPIGTRIEQIARPAIQITTTVEADDATLGTSRIGGVPDLPPNLEWPQNADKYLVFLAQINLAELPAQLPGLPGSGLLYFFHGHSDSAGDVPHQILYSDRADKLTRAQQPPLDQIDEEEDHQTYDSYRINMSSKISLPISKHGSNRFFDETDWRTYSGQYDELYDHLIDWGGYSGYSQLMGYPTWFDDDPSQEAQFVREGKKLYGKDEPDAVEVEKWMLLLELGSHMDTGMSWWDAGLLQFMIHDEDLAQLDFAHTYAVIQSS